MNNFFQSKIFVAISAVIGLIVVAVIIVVFLMNKSAPGQTVTEQPELKTTKTELSGTELPKNFPTNLPIEAGAKINQNYNTTTNDGRIQSTRSYETTKSLDNNYSIYRDYAVKNGWELGTGVEQKDIKVVSATKGNLTLVVTINKNAGSTINTVNITVTETNPAPSK